MARSCIMGKQSGCSVFRETKYYLSHVIADDTPLEINFDCVTDIMDE